MPSESRTISGHGQIAAVTRPIEIDSVERLAALAAAPIAVAWLSLNGEIIEGNAAFAGLLRFDAGALPGRRLVDLIDDAEAVEALLDDVRVGNSGSGRIRCGGSEEIVRCDVHPVRQAGKIVASRWFMTEESPAPAAEAHVRSGIENVPELVHRLRNGLAPLTSGLDVLELDGADAETLAELRGQLSRIEREFTALLEAEPRSRDRADAVPISQSGVAAPGPAVPAQPRILIVDDNPAIHRALELLIRTLGYKEVETASSGEEALSRCGESWPSLVLLDVRLPGQDGFAVARRFRALPGGSELVLVALSGYAQPGDRQEAAAAGFDEYLVKPCRLDDLDRVLKHPRLKGALEGPLRPASSRPDLRKGSGGLPATPADAAAGNLERSERFGQLLREFVHDARTAAFSLQIHQHLLEKSTEPPTAEESAAVLSEYLAHCEILHGVLRRAGQLLRDEFDPHFGCVDPAAVIERAVALVSARPMSPAIRFHSGLRDNASVRGDGELLAQAVVELLDNAAEASRDGETVTIDANCGDSSVAISVSDCGPGIPAYQIDLVQEPFTRLSGKLEPLRGHIGIGLAIVRRIVELHGGRLVFAGIEPHGCRATIELPATAPCRG